MVSISKYLVPQTDMVQWCSADESPIYSGSTLVGANDLGPGNRDMSVSSSNPTVSPTNAAINGMPSFDFSGSSNPLNRTGAVSVQHYFILASITPSTFSDYMGVVSGLNSLTDAGMLVGNNSGTKFFDFGSSRTFYSRGYAYDATNMIAPMGGTWALIEVIRSVPLVVTGLQIGQDREFTTRKLNGKVAEWMFYSTERPDTERARIYRYFASKYQHWEKTTTGKYVFPFTSNWGPTDPARKIVLYDEAEDGSPVYRTKKALKRYTELDFQRRTQDEIKAAKSFFDQHHPGTQFIYRDKTVTPFEELTYRFAPDAEVEAVAQGPNNFNYKLKMNEV